MPSRDDEKDSVSVVPGGAPASVTSANSGDEAKTVDSKAADSNANSTSSATENELSNTPASTTSGATSQASPTKPYYAGVEERGDVKYKIFDFPNTRSFGKLNSRNYDGVEQEAQGRQLVHADAELLLRCNNEVILNPALLDGFGPSDLFEIECIDLFRVGNEFIQHVGKLADLRGLRIETGEIDDECLKYIDPLSDLKALHLNQTKVRGSGIAKLRRIHKLKRVTFAAGLETSALLTALAHSPCLSDLNVENALLSPQDFKAIATITQLRQLTLNATGLTNADMEVISTLPQLKILDARFCLIDANCLKSCKKMKALRQLQLSGEKWREGDTAAFASALKSVTVR